MILGLGLPAGARAAIGVEGGLSSEFLAVTAGNEDGEKSFVLMRPMGLAVGLDLADSGDSLHPIVGAQFQVPGSLSRLESTKFQVGGRYYFGLAPLASSDSASPFVVQTRSSAVYFLQTTLVYQRLYYAFLDADKQPLSFDRSAAGFGVGVGVDLFPEWLSRSQSPWRFGDDDRLRLRAVADLSVSLLSFGFYATGFQSGSLKLMVFKPL